ncbi:MAG: hypothetical protein M3P15_02570 [Actinomycetota bacterium]|nr:hypothetical protein [Actinomycetota bacterium]
MQRAVSVTAALALVLLPGCGSSQASDTAVKETLEGGVARAAGRALGVRIGRLNGF